MTSSAFQSQRPVHYRTLLALAWPLLISTGAISLLNFIDRIFLSWDSTLSVAAALPAGSLNFAIAILMIGMTSYAGTFVAQYLGEKRPHMVGPILAQAFYVALLSLILIPLQYAVAPFLFAPFTESAELAKAQEQYFTILSWGIFPMCWSGALGGLFSGLGRTRVIMMAHLCMLAVNTLLAYAWIFGHWGLPAWGLAGAAWATVVSQFVPILVFLVLSFGSKSMRREFHLMKLGFDGDLCRRLLKYGFPAGVHGCADVATFSVFMLLCGGLSLEQLAASNIVFQIHIMGFLPALGLGMAVGIAVGGSQGSGERALSLAYARAGAELSSMLALIVGALYVGLGPWLIGLFAPDQITQEWLQTAHYAHYLLYFAVALVVGDFLQVNYSAVLKAAGDTSFVMYGLGIASLLALVLPAYAVVHFHGNVYGLWIVMGAYLWLLAGIFYVRYKGQKWLGMKVTGH